MPLEIKELHIKATVDNSSANGNRTGGKERELQKMKAEIIKECVEQVFEILKQNKER